MTTTFGSQYLSVETWRRLAVGATALVIVLLATLTTILLVGSSSGSTRPRSSAPYDPACQSTTVVHAC